MFKSFINTIKWLVITIKIVIKLVEMSQVAELVTILNHSSSESEDESARSSTNSKSKCKRGTNKQCNIIGSRS